MYSRQEVQVWAGVLERVNHVVRYIRAGARLSVDPSAPPKYKRQKSPQHKLEIMYTLGPSLPPVCYPVIDRTAHQLKNTHHIHIDRFQIIQIRIIRLLRTVWIECARNLKELLPEVREKPSWRDPKGTVSAMSRPPTRNLVCLDLQSLKLRLSIELMSFPTYLSQEGDQILRTPPWILVYHLPVIIVRGRWARVHHDCQILK